MRIEVLQTFVAIAEEENFSRAAKRLYLDQSVATRHLNTLENELGVKLIERTTRSLSLTEEGELFLEPARSAITAYHEGVSLLEEKARFKKNQLRIGYIYLFIDTSTLAWLDEFLESQQNNPTIDIVESDPLSMVEQVKNGLVDGAFIGVTDDTIIPSILNKMLIYERDEVIVVGRTNPLAEKVQLTVEDIKHSTFLYPFREPSSLISPVRRDLEDRDYTVTIQHSEFERSAFEIIERSSCVMDIPENYRFDNDNVLRIPYSSSYVIGVYFIWNRTNPKSLLKDFVDFLQATCE